MKNYYDELEVSKTASKEVIEKVYKVLAKKYHPDTTQEIDKQAAEEKFKIISEAYEVLSDDEKRKKYDAELEQLNPTISYEEYINIVNQRDALNNSLNNLKNEFNQFRNASNNYNINQTYNNPRTQYNQQNSNYNTVNNSYNNINNYNNSNTNTNSKRPKYYNVATGKPVSAISYYIYRIKKFFSNMGFILLAILALLLAINSFLPFDIFSIFI